MGLYEVDGTLRLQVPSGYEQFTRPLVAEFGTRLVVEVDDGWRGYAV
jgi:hypothetical protein